jgi:hypothetical protein
MKQVDTGERPDAQKAALGVRTALQDHAEAGCARATKPATLDLRLPSENDEARRLWRASALTPVRHGSDRELEAMKAIILRAGTVLLATIACLLVGIALAGVG